MSIFEELTSLCADFDMCKSAFKRGHDAAKDICAAIRYRLETEDAQIDERISELKRRQNDPGCNATVRRMIALELEQIQNRATPSPTLEEQEAFLEEITAAEDALRDMRQLREKIRRVIDDLNEAIKQMRAETLGLDVGLCSKWIEVARQDFERLGKG